ncbi:hypothetical protein PESP_a0211 [Pseudoalteromonas espejiana DSM 9414]|nr:hypothetical protein PESP_a0211 [Pseudoalteromonas espejiana DSM 9414]
MGFIIAALNALVFSKLILCHYFNLLFIKLKNVYAQNWQSAWHYFGA